MGRPSKPLLSTDRIAGAAMDLVNKTGGFTVPELARALKVSPSSLYNHVAGREQIVELLRERAMSDVALPADDAARPPGSVWPASPAVALPASAVPAEPAPARRSFLRRLFCS